MIRTSIIFLWMSFLAFSPLKAQTNAFLITQKIELTGVGEINYRSTYSDVIKGIGEPDSIHGYTKPTGKNLPFYKLYYDNQNLIIRFNLNPLEKLTDKTKNPSILLYNKSTLALNGILPSKMDSALIVKHFGKPKDFLKTKDELILSYSFNKDKLFSLLDFYLNSDGTINQIRIIFGKY